MNVPVRPAPAPPVKDNLKSLGNFFAWNDGNDAVFDNKQSTVQTRQMLTVKRRPPPRPPPPKIEHKKQQKQVSSRERLVGLFTRRRRTDNSNRIEYGDRKNQSSSVFLGSSRPYSPSPTGRSSSDGVSVNSFGSDGSVSNNTAIGGSTSVFESGFEEEFDFWLSVPTEAQKKEQNDPWKVTQQDPFSPPSQMYQQMVHSVSFPVEKPSRNTPWAHELSNPLQTPPLVVKSTTLSSSVPTIIRAKQPRPAQISKLLHSGAQEKNVESHSLLHAFSSISLLDTCKLSTPETEETSDSDDQDDWEPPMPSIPPPPPPREVVEELAKIAPPVPPKPQLPQISTSKPHGIALFDYETSHLDDLNFKVNDVILLKRRINNDWLYGQLGSKEGMFPSNFIKVIIPLDDQNDLMVKALYQFTSETPSDLEFPEGASIKVLGQISEAWLYGEYGGNKGQFPAIYVDHIPSGLPEYCN